MKSHLMPDCHVFDDLYLFTAEDEVRLEDPECMAFIESEIARIKPVMCFFDSFYTFFSGNSNREEELIGIVNTFSHWIARHDCGIAVLCHFNKGPTSNELIIENIQGSVIWGKWYSTALLVGNPNARKDVPEAEVDEDGALPH